MATMSAMLRRSAAAAAILLPVLGLGFLPAVENANALGEADAPTVSEDQPIQADITVRNPNDFAVRVERVEANCTCTRLDLPERFLLPKATTVLHAAVDSANRSGYQQMGVSIFLTDPDSELISVALRWHVAPLVTVDALPPGYDPKTGRPADRAWRDVYRYTAQVRPDELNRMRKRLLVRGNPATDPPGGLRILGIDYPGTLWAFTSEDLGNGSWLIRAAAKNETAEGPLGTSDERVVVRTNQPRKPTFTLEFAAILSRDIGRAPAEIRDP